MFSVLLQCSMTLSCCSLGLPAVGMNSTLRFPDLLLIVLLSFLCRIEPGDRQENNYGDVTKIIHINGCSLIAQ